jgi:beta-lactamase regulating signal transducer with metallopeptidase domain
MWDRLDRLGLLLIDSTLAATVFLSLAVLLMLACHQPARRLVIAQSAVLLAILLIPLVAVSPLPRFVPLDRLIPGWTATTSRQPWSTSAGLFRIATIGYLGGVVLGVGWTAIGLWGFRRLLRDSDRASPETLEFYVEVARNVGGRGPIPDLRVSPRVTRPVLAGLSRPVILIPTELDEPGFERDSLRLILIHELAHADRGDITLGAVASLARSVWFFLPQAWWLRRQVRMDQEFVADQETADLVGSSAEYAMRLVALAGRHEGSRSPQPISDSTSLLQGRWRHGGFKTPILQRVVMLLHAPWPTETRPPRRWSAIIPVVLLIMAILASGIRVSLPPGGLSTRGSAAAIPGEARVFRVSRLVAAPRAANHGGRSIPYSLPLVLPSRFELSVEIEASSSSLSRMWIAGYPLSGTTFGIAPRTAIAGPANEPSRRHVVQLSRDRAEVRLFIDGRSIPVVRTDAESADSLTIEPPPDQTATLRDLVVRW